ncbi:hypothetical protein [Altererythrobacter sp. GH1-8]|uniref:hypothetical protein n=1 Tax=Altererythrobacter sp. GH1-8 TaxID=3349333 RepID=UPI00374DDD2D
MKLIRAKTALSVSALALTAIAMPALAQNAEQSSEDTNKVCHDDAGEVITCVVIGGTTAYITGNTASYALDGLQTDRTDINKTIKQNYANRQIARTAASGKGTTTNYPLLKDPDAVMRDPASPAGQAARAADNAEMKTLNQRGEVAQRARANAIAGSADDIARAEARGNLAQKIRANKVAAPSATPAGSARVAMPADIDDLNQRGQAAQRARANPVAGSADDIARLEARGNATQNSRFQARNANAAARGGPSFDRAMQGRIGPEGTSRLIGQGDAAQAARGRVINEGQLARNINNAGGDVGRLNQAGRSAQATRGAGIARGAPNPAPGVGKPAGKMGKLTKFGGNVAKGVVVGVAATEGVKALTGAEMHDPLSTGFRYGSAIFDKDVTMGDVARDRWQHHKRNFSKIGETLTTKGKLKENMQTYGADKREKIGNATGMELDAMRDTRQRYADALKGPNKIKNVGQVAGDRAKHHWDNTKKVGSKVGCGIGNLFRSKENDKDC